MAVAGTSDVVVLPDSGPGSPAGYSRRFLALLIDGAACVGVASLIKGYEWQSQHFVNAAVLFVEYLVLLPVGGQTLGMWLTRIRVVPVRGRRIAVRWAVIRTVLLFLVVPAILSDQNQRGLHDRASGTAVVRT